MTCRPRVLTDGIAPISIAEGEYEGRPNPHGWMGPDNAAIYIDNIRDALSEYDPENAGAYAVNADAYKQAIRDAVAPPGATGWRRSPRNAAGW